MVLLTCWDQYEMCNPSNKECSGLGGLYSLSPDKTPADVTDRLAFNPAQRATARRFFESAYLGGQIYPLSDSGSPGELSWIAFQVEVLT